MTSHSYQAIWKQKFQVNRAGLIQILGWDPFRNWELNTGPEGLTEDYLFHGLKILYSQGDADLARRFLERCLLIAERAMAEEKLQSPRCRDNFPLNRGRLLRARAYAQGILGAPWDEATLRQAATDFEQTCAGYPKHKWDELEEDTYLAAVRLALLGADGDRVQRLLSRRRAFRWRAEQHELVKALLPLLRTPAREEALQARFDTYFDQVRDPNFKPEGYMPLDVLRLELSLLRDKYLISSEQQIDWQRTIEAVAQ
jgi:hypothetical protein